eukprot:691812_1
MNLMTSFCMELNQAVSPKNKQDRTLSFIDAEAAKEFDCCICLQLLSDPVDIGCNNGHIFCRLCIARLILQSNNNQSNFLCPSCRCVCQVQSVRKMPFIQRQVNNLKIHCPNQEITPSHAQLFADRHARKKRRSRSCITVPGRSDHDNSQQRARSRSRSRSLDRNTNTNDTQNKEEKAQESCTDNTGNTSVLCDWKGACGNLCDHLRVCEYEIVLCNHCRMACMSKELEEHYAICPSYPLQCYKCRKLVKRSGLTIHLEIACPKVETVCACGERLLREAQPMHCQRVCPESPLPCHYAIYGCGSMIKRKDMGRHVETNTAHHLQLVTQQYEYLSQNLAQRIQQIEQHLNLDRN